MNEAQSKLAALLADGWTLPKIAKKLGVPAASVYNWRNGREPIKANADKLKKLKGPPK